MVSDFSKPLKGSASKADWVDESRFGLSNIVEGLVNSYPALISGIDATAQKGAAAIAGAATRSEDEQFFEAYSRELATIQENDKRLNTIKNIVNENVYQPLADLTDSFFTAAEGDRSKIQNANLKENIYQTGGNLIAPLPFGGALSKTASMLGRAVEGAAVGTGFGIVAGGQADTLQGYGANILTGTGLGAATGVAAPHVAKAIGHGADFVQSKARQITDYAKGTSARIQQRVQQMTRDQISESMRTIGSSQDRMRAQQNQMRAQNEAANSPGQVAQNPEQSNSVRLKSGVRMNVEEHPVVQQSVATLEQKAGRELTAQEKQSVAESFVNANVTLRRRQIAAQKLRELRAKSEMETLQVKQVGIEQQMQRIKEYLAENPKPLFPSKKQKVLRANLLRAEQMNARLKAQESKSVGPNVIPEEQRLVQAAIKENLTPSINQAQADIMTLKAEISKTQEALVNPKMKVDKSLDGSLESYIAEKLREKSSKLNKKEYESFAGKNDDSKLARRYLSKEGGKSPSTLAKELIDAGVTNEEEAVVTQKIVDFMQEHNTNPDSYYIKKAKAQASEDISRLGADLSKRESELAQMKELRDQIEVPKRTEPAPLRQKTLDYISNRTKELERIRAIQQTKIANNIKERLGVDSTDPVSLKSKIEELQLQSEDYKIQQKELETQLAKQALSEAEGIATSEQYLKEQGLSYAGYENGKMKVATFDPNLSKTVIAANPKTTNYRVKRNGSQFSIEIDADGKPVTVEREATPVEKVWHRSQEGIHTQIDRIFGLTEEGPVVTEADHGSGGGKPPENAPKKTGGSDENPPPEDSESRILRTQPSKKDQRLIREQMQPIQNAVDEIHQELGNRVAKLEANYINKPTVLLKGLAESVGYETKNFNPNDFVKHLIRLWGSKAEDAYTYNHVAQMPERLSVEQREFLAKSQAFWLEHRAGLEAMGIDPAKLIEGLYAPREVDYNKWFDLQDSTTKTEIKDLINSKEDGYYDEDKIMGELTEVRKFNIIPDSEMPAYRSGAEAIVIRIKKIAQQQALQEFFGNRLEKGKGYSSAVNGLLDEFGIQGSDRRDAQFLLQRLFDKTPYTDNAALNLLNRFRFAVILGAPATAVKQPVLGAIRNSFRFNIENAIKGISTMNDPAFQGHFAGLMNDIQKGDIGSKLQLADMAATGMFRFANQKEAAMGISSAYHAMVNDSHKALNGKASKSFSEYMKRRYGADPAAMDALIVKLAAQKGRKYAGFDLDVLNAVTTYARDRGSLALSKADKTAAALDPRNMVNREAYKLLTYNMKDTNTLIDMTAGEMKRGNWGTGMINIVTQVALLTALNGLATDQILRVGSGTQTAAQGHSFSEGYERGGIARTVGQVQNAALGLIPFLSTYSVEKLLDPQTVGETIANAVFKGLGTTSKLVVDSVKATVESVKASNKEGAFPDLSGALNPELNPSFKNLPPRILAETAYNIIDPLVRGDKAQVVLKEQEKLQYEASQTEEAKAKKLEDDKKKYRHAGVPQELAGTKKGAVLYEKATNKGYKAYSTASRSFTPEDYKLGMQVTRELNQQPLGERKAYFDSLPSVEQKAYMAATWKRAQQDYVNGKIDVRLLKQIEKMSKDYSFPTTIEKAKRAVKKLINNGR